MYIVLFVMHIRRFINTSLEFRLVLKLNNPRPICTWTGVDYHIGGIKRLLSGIESQYSLKILVCSFGSSDGCGKMDFSANLLKKTMNSWSCFKKFVNKSVFMYGDVNFFSIFISFLLSYINFY